MNTDLMFTLILMIHSDFLAVFDHLVGLEVENNEHLCELSVHCVWKRPHMQLWSFAEDHGALTFLIYILCLCSWHVFTRVVEATHFLYLVMEGNEQCKNPVCSPISVRHFLHQAYDMCLWHNGLNLHITNRNSRELNYLRGTRSSTSKKS